MPNKVLIYYYYNEKYITGEKKIKYGNSVIKINPETDTDCWKSIV